VVALTCLGLTTLAACADGEGSIAQPSATTTDKPSSAATPRLPSVVAPGSVGTTAADLPRVSAQVVPIRLVVASAGLTMPIEAVGVGGDGQMALPPRPTTIGWYRFGPSPGDAAGSVVLGGHIDSRQYGVGPLARLRTVRPGDLIEITRADGEVLRYRASAVRDIPKQKLAVDELFDREGLPRLRIVTCGGPYDPDAGGYRDNLVVTAVATS
jgi:sortase family protein